MRFLELLRPFFFLGVGEPDPEPDPAPDATDDPAPDLDVDLDAADPEPDKDERPSKEEFEAAASQGKADKERADRLERELADTRRQRAAHPDPEYAREEAKLQDEKTSDLEKWQIRANRELRAGRQTSQAALAQAYDVSDRAAFRSLEAKKPALFKRYEKEVEEQLVKVRQSGGHATREDILKYLVGRDAMDDKFARKKSAAKTEEKTTVARGKLPGARSDVSGKTTMNEREKRAKRLEGVQI